MSISISLPDSLTCAIRLANNFFKEEAISYRVAVADDYGYRFKNSPSGFYGFRDGRSPVFLNLIEQDNKIRRIGCIFIVDMKTRHWDHLSFKDLELPLQRIYEKIVKKITLFLKALDDENLFVDEEKGGVFDFKGCKIELVEVEYQGALYQKIVQINGNILRYQGRAIRLPFLTGEGIVSFKPAKDVSGEDYLQIIDPVDQRPNNKLGITSEGNLYPIEYVEDPTSNSKPCPAREEKKEAISFKKIEKSSSEIADPKNQYSNKSLLMSPQKSLGTSDAEAYSSRRKKKRCWFF